MLFEFEDNYFVDECGNVYKKMKPYIMNSGYKDIKINGKHYPIHRLVASSFLRDKCGDTVNHKDGNRLNNNVENLEWCTQLQNIRHYLDGGGASIKNFVECELYKGDELIGSFQSILDAARYCQSIGLSYSTMCKYLKFKDYKIIKR